MYIIGTAGHVDHGKSTLIEALTGIHPDRLKEEKEREMTIDLGFAWMTLPGGEQIGIVDVPGHRDFIENMLAGIGGIDAVLFVVAADEGVMPQTREHLAILDILQVGAGIVALTKIDMIDDPGWLDMVEEDVRQTLQGTVLADAPILRVSSTTGKGIRELIDHLQTCLENRPPRMDLGRARLPIDRVFTISGFGTVVTGTLLDGRLQLGEEVEILPSGQRGRIRGLQTHKRKEQTAYPGSRTAVNISGIEVHQIRRGEVLVHPGKYQPGHLLDVHFRLLPDASGPVKHNSEVKFFLGAAEIIARVRTLGSDEIKPGEEGWLQLELREPAVAVRGDHYILRRPSPGETLGGGVVVDPSPKGRHRRFSEEVLSRLESLLGGSPADVLLESFQLMGPVSIREAVARARLAEDQASSALHELLEGDKLVLLEEGEVSSAADLLAISRQQWTVETEKVERELANYHRTYPLRTGMPREELKSRLKIRSPRLFSAEVRRWVEDGTIQSGGSYLWKPGHTIRLTQSQNQQAERLLEKFARSPYSPPTIKEAQAEVGEDVYQAMINLGYLVAVSTEVAFRKQDYDQMVEMVREHFQSEETLTAAQFRDRLNTSRRYVLAFLEHLDAIGMTVREGDARKLRK